MEKAITILAIISTDVGVVYKSVFFCKYSFYSSQKTVLSSGDFTNGNLTILHYTGVGIITTRVYPTFLRQRNEGFWTFG